MDKSKEEAFIELFFNEPTKQWHFEEILHVVRISRKPAVRWLNIFQKRHLIKKIRLRGRMPYYIADYQNSNYQNEKRIFALNKLYKSGFLNHVMQLPKVSAVILFGSFVRWDWHKQSDIDVFVYGDCEGLQVGKYELALNRDIQLFECKDKQCIKQFPEGLLKNIVKGDIIKGNIDFLKVEVNA